MLLQLNLDLSDELRERIKKLKANTFQDGVIKNMIEGINNSKNQPFEKVLFGIGVRNIGENTAQLLARHFGTIEKLAAATSEELLEINGIGETLVTSIHDFFGHEANQKLIDRLEAHGLNLKVDESKQQVLGSALAGKRVLASGKLINFKRDEIVDFVQSHGGQYISTVSKNLDFIIEGEGMGPSKKDKAIKLGVPMISEEEFLRMVTDV
ncbi:MAG: DNA ligase (NAD+) [Planctomycetota bacterium]